MNKVLLSLFCFISVCLNADIVDPKTHVSFPKEVSFEGEKLTATGVATREKFGLKVYSIASYLQNDTILQGDLFEAIIDTNNAKQLTMHWLMKVQGNKVKKGFTKALKKALPKEDYKSLKSDIETLLSVFDPGVNKGDIHIFRSLTGDTVQAVENDKVVATIKSTLFQKAFWSIWFGEKSVVDKDNLIQILEQSK